jgi:hypothetical protein
LPEAELLAAVVTTTKLVALATLPKDAPPTVAVPTVILIRVAAATLIPKAVGTLVPVVVVCPGPTPINGVNPKSILPVPVSVRETSVTTAPAGRIKASVPSELVTFAVALYSPR